MAIREKNPEATFPPKSLEEYAIERVAEEVGDGGVDRTKAILEGYIYNTLFSLAVGEDERAAGLDNYAQLIWQNYQNRVSMPAAQKRVGLPPLEDIKREVRDKLLDPQEGIDPEIANQIRSALGLPAPSANGAKAGSGEQVTEKPATNVPAATLKEKK